MSLSAFVQMRELTHGLVSEKEISDGFVKLIHEILSFDLGGVIKRQSSNNT